MEVLGKQKDKKLDDKISLYNPEPDTAKEDCYGIFEERPKPYDEQILRAELQRPPTDFTGANASSQYSAKEPVPLASKPGS